MLESWREFLFAWKVEHEEQVFKVLRVIFLMYATVLAQVVVVLVGFQLKRGVQLVLRHLKGIGKGEKGSKSKRRRPEKKNDDDAASCVKTMIVLGSGGHTAEVLRVLRHLSGDKYRPRVYAVSSTDEMSAQRALRMEKEVFHIKSNNTKATSSKDQNGRKKGDGGEVKVVRIPRSREVGQSYVSSVFTTLYSFFASIKTVALERPTLLLCNGPGTCLPVCVSMRLLKPFSGKIVFIESICRTRSLSLTGKILYYTRLADTLFVQWPQLSEKYPLTKYAGRVF
jgi:beta-1,4-N-acetylglucosaminyltransferase